MKQPTSSNNTGYRETARIGRRSFFMTGGALGAAGYLTATAGSAMAEQAPFSRSDANSPLITQRRKLARTKHCFPA